MIKCDVEIYLSWKKDCVLKKHYNKITGGDFKIRITHPHVPVVTFCINDNIKFLEHFKQGFRGTVSWNKYISEIITQPKKKNLDYMIDPTFRNINRLFAFSLKNVGNDPTRSSFDKYYKL